MSVQQPNPTVDPQQKFSTSLESLSSSSHYYFNKETQEIESTSLGWRIFEWLKGFVSEDMCDEKLISMYFLKEVSHLPNANLDQSTVRYIHTIAKNLNLLPKDESTEQNSNTTPTAYQLFFNSLYYPNNDPTLAEAAADLFYKTNKEKLTLEHPSLAGEISQLAQRAFPPLAQSPPQGAADAPTTSPSTPTIDQNIRTAIEGQQSEEVETYLLRVSNLNAKDEEGNSFLHVAVSNFGPQMMGIIQSLAKAGVDPFQKNNDGKTPLDLCVDSSIVSTYLFETTIDTLINPSIGKNRTPDQIDEIKQQAKRLYPTDQQSQVKFLGKLGITLTSPQVTSTSTANAFRFQDLDRRFSDLKRPLGVMVPPFPAALNIPDILFSDEEKKEISESKLEERLESLEAKLLTDHKEELRQPQWHGYASLQRIIWQDESVVKELQNPLMVKLILLRAKENKLSNLKSGNLATFLLYGLTSNNLSYLTSVSPNRISAPSTGNWEQLVHLRQAFRVPTREATPRLLDTTYVDNFSQACKTIEEVVKQLSIPQDSSQDSSIEQKETLTGIEQKEAVKHAISGFTPSQLMTLFNTLMPDENTVTTFVRGAAGSSTKLESMYGQTLEVMSEYDGLLKNNGNNVAEVLGYALVSHIFDARHLAAILYYHSHSDQVGKAINSNVDDYTSFPKAGNEATSEEIQNRLIQGQKSLKSLMDDLEKQELEQNAEQLLSIRLQQVIALIIDNPKSYNVEQETITTFIQNQVKK